MRGQLLISRVSRAVQADRGERSLRSLSPCRSRFLSLGQEESGEISLIDGIPGAFQQTNISRRGIEETTVMSVIEDFMIIKLFIIEQEASGERSER